MSLVLESINPLKAQLNGLRAQLEAEWSRRGWSLTDLPQYLMMAGTDDGGDDDGGDDGDDDTDDGDDDDDDSGDDDDDDGGDDDSDDEDDEEAKAKKAKAAKKAQSTAEQRRIKKLSDENARWRNRFKSEKAAREELNSRLAKLEAGSKPKGKPEEAQLEKELDDVRNGLSKANNTIKSQAVSIAVRDNLSEHSLNPKKAGAIEKLVRDNDDVEVGDDGRVDGIEDALEKIAEEYPEWVLNDDEDEKDKSKRRRNSNNNSNNGDGQRPSGKSTNRTRSRKDGLDRVSLENKFPALRR